MDLAWWADTIGSVIDNGKRTIADGLRAIEEHLDELDDSSASVHPESPTLAARPRGLSSSTAGQPGETTAPTGTPATATAGADLTLPVDDDVRAMAAQIASGTAAAFMAVAPLSEASRFAMTLPQKKHALAVLEASSDLARFRYEVTKHQLSDTAFWGLYFRHHQRLVASKTTVAVPVPPPPLGRELSPVSAAEYDGARVVEDASDTATRTSDLWDGRLDGSAAGGGRPGRRVGEPDSDEAELEGWTWIDATSTLGASSAAIRIMS